MGGHSQWWLHLGTGARPFQTCWSNWTAARSWQESRTGLCWILTGRSPVDLLAGILVGRSGLKLVDPSEPAFAFLADVGFALVMFVASSYVPLREASLRAS
ncbi:hypothetical protein NHF46_08100 [Arthrobacter alpinus]|nr:hypothetical protein [Arthrobacter alpinus]